jgi:hypothetical protein
MHDIERRTLALVVAAATLFEIAVATLLANRPLAGRLALVGLIMREDRMVLDGRADVC